MTDYTRYSYDELVQRMTSKLQNAEGWGEAFDSSMGQTLTQLVADATDYLHYIQARRTIENYLTTAVTRSATFARSSELGYRPKRQRANYGTIEITLKDSDDNTITAINDLTIPKMTTFTFQEQTYVLTDDVTFASGESTKTATVKAGVPEQLTFETTEFETTNYIPIEDYIDIDNDTFVVSSNNIEYQDVNKTTEGLPARRALSFVGTNEYFYDIRYTIEEMRILLGDGTFGFKPKNQVLVDIIRIPDNYEPLITTGNTFTTAYTATDIGGNPYELSITNTTKIFRGQQEESIQDVKRNATAYAKTNGKAVSNDDINFWTKESNIGGIVDARAVGEQELDTVINNINNVYINYLKDDGTELTIQEKEQLRDWLEAVMMSTVHPVIQPVSQLPIGTVLDARKHPSLEMSDEEFYAELKSFMDSYFELKEGSIGREIQHSEIVRDLHKLEVTRNNITYPLVDYVKLEMNAYYPFTIPLDNKSVNINIADTYTLTDGDEFILSVQNIPCVATVNTGDSNLDILTKMRDEVLTNTPFTARVQLEGIVVDGFGNPLPVEIDNSVGSGILIGIETPYQSPNKLIQPPAIGANIAEVALSANAVTVQHYYYSSVAGRRPLIPLRTGTEITFTAPTDTDVNVYTRTTMQDSGTESLLTTISAGATFNQIFNSEHSLQFEYVNDSSEDVTVTIDYPSIIASDLGLRIETKDGFGTFTLITSSGDLANDILVEKNIQIPPTTRNVNTETVNIKGGSLEILDSNGSIVYRSTTSGEFLNPDGTFLNDGTIDQSRGLITIPNTLSDGDYYFKYKQNDFQNFKTDETGAIVLSSISNNINTPSMFSRIRIV